MKAKKKRKKKQEEKPTAHKPLISSILYLPMLTTDLFLTIHSAYNFV